MISSAKGKFTSVSTADRIPNQDTLNKVSEQIEELQSLSKKVKSRNDSLSNVVTTSEIKAQYYRDLYKAEKKCESDYHQEIVRQTQGNIRRQQEALKNNKHILR
jgi:hypothetical protein